MHFDLSEERQMLADTTRRFIADRYDIKVRHANAKSDDGFNRDTWNEFADLGLIGALLPVLFWSVVRPICHFALLPQCFLAIS